MKKPIAEFIGTFALVLFGCGAAVLAGAEIGQLGIALAFGLAIVAMAYGIGPISGCHVNPAVSFGVFLAGRMTMKDMLVYWLAQMLGAIAAAAFLMFLLSNGASGFTGNLGQNGWGPGYLGEYSMVAALVFEIVMTFLFVTVILGVTGPGGNAAFAGLAIGLTLAVIHIAGIQVTGVSVNPARSFGPAVMVGGTAIAQIWLFLLAPMIGAGLAGFAVKMKLIAAD
jgi:aquaporin Z